MGRVKDTQLFLLIKNFFLVYLPIQRNVSEHTLKTYRTTLNQYLAHTAESKKVSVMSVTLDMINKDSINAYLDFLTEERNLSSATRNNRLAALKSFINYAAACRPEYISLSEELSAIKQQKEDIFAKVEYMSEKAIEILLREPNIETDIGKRDQMIMSMLYDTGARIEEVLTLRLCDLKLGKTSTVQLLGKGRKKRLVSLMANTVSMLQKYIETFHTEKSMFSENPLFYVVRKGYCQRICDDTVRIRIKKYADSARKKCREIPERVHPHLLRHSRAMHLYQHGMDLTLISQWLGHSSIETTLVYAHADTEMKRKAIEKAMGKSENLIAEPVNYTVDDELVLKKLYGLA